jgi:hypothetical protein
MYSMFKALRNQKDPNHERIDELLSAYLDGMLGLEDRAMLESRLRREPALVTRLDGLRQTKKVLAGLPQMDVPRNFILSPSMVVMPKPAAELRRRRAWPIWGWATAVVTLLFLLVFAGDLFIVAPSLRTDQANQAEQTKALLSQTPMEQGAELAIRPPEGTLAEPAAPALATAEAVPVTLEAEAPPQAEPRAVISEPLPEESAQPEIAELEGAEAPVVDDGVVPTSEPEVGLAQTELSPPPSGGGGEAPATSIAEKTVQATVSSTAEVEMFAAEAMPEAESTPVSGDAVTAAVEMEEIVPLTPPAELVGTEEMPLTAAPLVEEEQQQQTVPEVAVVPPETTPLAVDTGQVAEHEPGWLVPLEIGLGLTAIVLAVVTLILRQRGV